MKITLYNTLHRKAEPFLPLHKGEVGLYTCGPTVYNFAHIGNLRTYVFEDLLRRMFEYWGYAVHHVMNVTDVGHLTDDADEGEDKMLVGAREKKKSVWEIADFFSDAFFRDIQRLNIEKPETICRATDHIEDMIRLIEVLEERGYTYNSGGNIYFDIEKFPDYGKLALLDRQELLAGARIDVDAHKKNPHDFALWFTNSKFEHQAMQWDSPWGRGYPGWHIECSAMSMKYLGEQFDIHCGGVDHIPVHHTNEIAQSEGATGKEWVRYWIHGEFLLMDKGKMAKSSGSFITLENLVEQGFDPVDYRYFCLGGHYRSQLVFSEASMEAAANARKNLMERLRSLAEAEEPETLDRIGPAAASYKQQFEEHISSDLNIPRALSVLWGLVKDSEIPAGERLSVSLEMDRVLGLDIAEALKPAEELESRFLSLIEERESARSNRNFARADEIRKMLLDEGIVLEDTAEGTRWKLTK